MKKIIKIISLILVIVLLSSLTLACSNQQGSNNSTSNVPAGGDGKFQLPDVSMTDETVHTEGYYQYGVYDNGSVIIYKHTGNEVEIVVPDMLGGYPVTTIASEAFISNVDLTSVTLGKNIQVIGSYAFYGCTKLANVTIPDSVWAIYPNAFQDTAWYDSLTKDEFVIVGDGVLLRYNGTDSTVVIPDTVKHTSAAFMGNETIKDVTVPDSVYTLGAATFNSSTVTRVQLGNNVIIIDESAFAYCYDLHYVNMPDSLKIIESYAFASCTGLNTLRIGKNVETICYRAFSRASQFNYMYLPKSVKTIEPFAFEDCNYLTHVYYEGSEEDFAALGIDGKNEKLSDAKKFYNYNYTGGIYEAQQ